MSLNTILATAPLTATGYHLKATGTALGQSLIWDNGTNVGIGNTNTSYTLDVTGTGRFTGITSITSATASTSTTTGALVVTGGLGIGGALFGTSAIFNHNDAPTIKIQRNGGTDTNTALEFTNASRSFFIGSDGTTMGLGGTSGSISIQPLQITSSGNVQINDSGSSSKLAVRGGNSTYPASSSASYTLSLNDPTSSAINVGGSVLFQGYKTSTTSGGNFAGIVGKKENGTAGDESGFLGFLTSNSTGTFSEKFRITSAGNAGLGVTPTFQSGVTELAVGSSNTNPRISGIRDGASAFMIYSASASTEIFERRSAELVLGTNNTGRVWINNVGLVGIGISGMAFQLDVGGGVNGVTQNVCRIGNTAGYTNGLTVSKDVSNIYTFDFGGNSILRSLYTYNNTSANVGNMYVSAGGTFERGTASSRRFKENIVEWNGNGLDTILALKPTTFTYLESYYKHPERVMLGLIAEDVAEVCPYLADYENEDGTGQVENVRYSTIVVPLIKAVQEQQIQIQNLQEQINILAK